MKNKCLKKYFLRLTAAVFCFLLFLLSSQDAFSQDFLSLQDDLTLLENLINDTIANTQEQQKLLEDLKKNLDESGSLIADYEKIITEQEKLLKDLQGQLSEMYETFRMQSSLSARSGQRSKFWRTFTIIAIPAAAAISGGVVWAAMR